MSAAASEVLPRLMTRAQLAAEQPAILAWAARMAGWAVDVSLPDLVIAASTVHPQCQAPLIVTADCSWYPVAAPAWRFADAAGDSPKSAFPAPGSTPAIKGSIFHPNGLICAPWNRLAYAEFGGVHNDWGGIVNWKAAAPGYTQAHTVADMLQTLAVHLTASPAMMI
jgi:hypothetical protein